MKKIILIPIVVSMLITSVCQDLITAKAESDAPNTIIEYYDNGYYAEITINTDYSSQYQIDDVTSVKSGDVTYKVSANQSQPHSEKGLPNAVLFFSWWPVWLAVTNDIDYPEL